ncbi:MAG: TIGR04283 family arsenosugar biosynthesis glycosyltransferase [Blastocatellia bacterium]|nr:TIGR04283 family arsenosugar biosynthesis glycosyltransferase [Blastocatellia bacterium]
MLISVIIPTYNEATTIRETAAALRELPGEAELIVVDGGSGDETMAIARAAGLRAIEAGRGRGPQMNAGAGIAVGDVLLFLHADTRLPAGAFAAIEALLDDAGVCGGHFSLVFEGARWESRALTRLYPFLRWFGMCYGDSAIFLRREVFERLGGYRDYPIFEDCDLFRRVGRLGRFVRLPVEARTSSRRFEGRFLRTFALWTLMQCLYWLGVSPARLDRLYRPLR